jgi:large subunit ribosomal protein L28
MAICELTGKRPVVKNLVSHSNIKTKKTVQPNVQKKRLFSQALGDLVTLRVATSAIRDLEHVGGLDRFILRQDNAKLSSRAMDVKRRIVRKLNRKSIVGKDSKSAKAAAGKA